MYERGTGATRVQLAKETKTARMNITRTARLCIVYTLKRDSALEGTRKD